MTPTPQADRRAQIIRLLETRDQHLPEPRRRSHIGSGFKHDTLAPTVCPVCEGCDSRNCTGCGGRGSIEVQRHRDPYAVNDVKAYGLTGANHDRGYATDAEIDRLRQQTRKPWASSEDELADANRRDYGWAEARKRMWRQYDYCPLDLALDQLAVRCSTAVRVLHQVYVYAWLTDASGAMLRVADLGLTFIDARFWLWDIDPIRAPNSEPPPRLAVGRVARCAGDTVYGERDREIRRAVLESRVPTVRVASTWGLSVSRVNRIIAKGDV